MSSCLEAQCLDLSIQVTVKIKRDIQAGVSDSAKTLSGVLCALWSIMSEGKGIQTGTGAEN